MARGGRAKEPAAVMEEAAEERSYLLLRCGCYCDSVGIITMPICDRHRGGGRG